MNISKFFRILLCLFFLLLSFAPLNARAATNLNFQVNSTADTPAAAPLDNGVCETAPGNGICTLRAALQKANAYPGGGATINIPARTYPRGDVYPALTGTFTIQGAGAGKTIIEVSQLGIGFYIYSGADVTIQGVTIQHASDYRSDPGTGILNGGTLTLRDSQISDNNAGAIYSSSAQLTIENSSLLRNNGFGALYIANSTAIVKNTLIAYNQSPDQGAVHTSSSKLTLINSTIRNNVVIGGAYGVHGAGLSIYSANDEVDLINVTIAGNVFIKPTATLDNTGGIANPNGGKVRLRNTLVTDNYVNTTASDCSGTLVSLDYNAFQTTSGCTITGTAPHDQIGGDLRLERLRDNSGPTQTSALLSGSPAIDQIPAGNCIDEFAAPLTNDQRGTPRPLNGLCDIGAFEGSKPVGGWYQHNLLRNGDAEVSAGSTDGAEVALPFWSVPGGAPTVVQYGATGGFPTAQDEGSPDRGQNFFAGGNSAFSSMEKSIDLRPINGSIDTGQLGFTLSAYLGGYADQDDYAQVSLQFQDGGGANLGPSFSITSPSAAGRQNQTKLVYETANALVPAGARSLLISVSMTRLSGGTFNDGYADDISLVLTAPFSVYLPMTDH